VELAAQQEADVELEALWTSVARVQDLVLDKADGPSSLAASLSMVVELLESRVDIATANRVCWVTRSVLVATLSHFPELEAKLELLRSGRNTNLAEDQVDALWTRMRLALDSPVSHVLPSVAPSPSDGVGE
jgi:hypothetical protein